MNKSLYGHMLSFLLGKYLGVEWLDCMVTVCLTFEKTDKLFSKVVALFYIPTATCESSGSFTPCQHCILAGLKGMC